MPKYFTLLLWIQACHQPVSLQCQTGKAWKRRNETFDCRPYLNNTGNEEIYYHCLPTIDGAFHEFCRGSLLIPGKECPFYKEDASIGNIKCTYSDCPTEEYLSNDVFQYPVCFNITTNSNGTDLDSAGISSSGILPTLSADTTRKPYVNGNIWNFIAFGTVSALLLNAVFIAVFSRSKRCKERNNDTHDDHQRPNIISQQYDESWELRSPIQSVETVNDAQTSYTIYDDCEAVYNHLNNKRAYLDNVTGDDY